MQQGGGVETIRSSHIVIKDADYIREGGGGGRGVNPAQGTTRHIPLYCTHCTHSVKRMILLPLTCYLHKATPIFRGVEFYFNEHLGVANLKQRLKGTLSRETELSVALQKEKSSHEFRNRFLTARKIEGWNSLPDSVKEAGSAAVFKR